MLLRCFALVEPGTLSEGAGCVPPRAQFPAESCIGNDAMPEFELISEMKPTGDQPQAIEQLVQGLQQGHQHQTLLGATGTGKTFVMANVIARVQRPTLVIAHNKTLAAQLYAEFKEFFPHNAVEYFVSYYDYYQPEAYLPRTDTYIEKDASINEELDRLRLGRAPPWGSPAGFCRHAACVHNW